MFKLLNKDSWDLNLKQLIEKRNQARKMMFLILINFMIIFGIAYFTWLFTPMFTIPILLFVINIFLFILVSQFKIYEFVLSAIICNKKTLNKDDDL